MERNLLDRVLEDLAPSAMLLDLRGWGESTMLRSFPDTLARAAKTGCQLRLVTNGQVLRPGAWDVLMRAHGQLIFSCDAADEELFTVLRRGGNLPRLRENVRLAVAARERYGAARENIAFNTVVSASNLDTLRDIVRLAADLSVGRIVLYPIITDLGDPEHLRNRADVLATRYEEAAGAAVELGVDLQLGAAPEPSLALRERVRTPACMHPWTHAYIANDGGVGFCDHLIGSSRYHLGKWDGGDFRGVWNSPSWQDLRRQHVIGHIEDRFSPCRWSFAQRYLELEAFLDPSRAGEEVRASTGPVLLRGTAESQPWTPELAGLGNGRTSAGTLLPIVDL
jgi:MoaA/NifB/PqqE/SkfB family radical SAM enzyme